MHRLFWVIWWVQCNREGLNQWEAGGSASVTEMGDSLKEVGEGERFENAPPLDL